MTVEPIPALEERTTNDTPAAGDSPVPAPTTGRRWDRPDGVTILALYHFLLAGLFLIGTVIMAIPTLITGIVGVVEDPEALIATAILGVIALVTMLLCLVLLVLGYGLWTQRQWARVGVIALSVLSLFAVPIGTVIGGLSIWYLLRTDVAERFQ